MQDILEHFNNESFDPKEGFVEVSLAPVMGTPVTTATTAITATTATLGG